jgi:hypothetical protein
LTAFTNTLFKRSRPYVFLILIAVLAYLPVCLMIFSLKNDILALEFPIKYFISECLHNGVQPFWFNTWGMGFPLESIITWSIFSPLQFLWGALFHYSLYTLHAEFIFYVSLCGCSFYYLLKRHIMKDRKLTFLLAVCYMLSGFIVSSSQWLLYISAAAFLPLIVSLMLSLLKSPSLRSSILFTCFFYCMITGIYVAFSIIICYILFGILLFYVIYQIQKKQSLKHLVVYLGLAVCLCIILLIPALLSSLNVLNHIQRGDPITTDVQFFSSNYFHPKGLSSLLFPFSSVRIHAANTEPLMQDCYIGLFPILLAPLWLKNRNGFARTEIIILAISIIFILISFGSLTPIRSWLNILPGFSYFRNAALFRIFFIFFFLIFISLRLKGLQWKDIFELKVYKRSIIGITIGLLSIILLLLIFNVIGIKNLSISNLKGLVTGISLSQTYLVNGLIQIFFLLVIVFFLIRNKRKLFELTLISDLILNTLICTPFFTVSSYSVNQVEHLINRTKGFPIQNTEVSQVPVTIQKGSAIWYNTNVFRKEVSSTDSYWGPLVLKNHETNLDDTIIFNHPIIFSPQLDSSEFKITLEEPNHIKAIVLKDKASDIILQQNYIQGWKAYKDHQPISIDTTYKSQMKIHVTSPGTIEFIYNKGSLLIMAVIIDILILLALIILYFIKLRRLHKGSLLNV